MQCWTAFPASSDPSAPGLPQARGGRTESRYSSGFPGVPRAIWHRGLRSGALGDVLGFVNGPRPPFNFPGAWLYSAGHPVLHLNGISHTDKQQRDNSGVIDHIAFGRPRNDGPYSTSRRSDQRQPLKHNGRACARPLRSRCKMLTRPGDNDVTDPRKPKLAGSVHIGGIARRTAHPSGKPYAGGPQMVEISRDGRECRSHAQQYSYFADCTPAAGSIAVMDLRKFGIFRWQLY